MTLFSHHLKIEEVTPLELDRMAARVKLSKLELAFALTVLSSFYITLVYGILMAVLL